MAGAAMFTGIVGGHLSDRVGRRPMMLIGRGFFCLTSLGALAAGANTLGGLSVIAATGALSSLGDAADSAMVADLVAPDDREQAYASLRVSANMGVVLGPPIGGLLLAIGSWNTLFVGAAVLSAISWALAWKLIPLRGRYTPERGEKSERIWVVFRDRPFMTLLGGAVLAWMVYVGFESNPFPTRWSSTTTSTGRCGARSRSSTRCWWRCCSCASPTPRRGSRRRRAWSPR